MREMKEDRSTTVWSSIVDRARRESATVSVRHVCLACRDAVSAGTTLILGDTLSEQEVVFATERLGEELVELQATHGQGPALDAAAGYGPVLVPDLAARECGVRWPGYSADAVRAGARAQFAFPLRVGAVLVGVLDLHRRTAGSPAPGQLADALAYADAAVSVVLNERAGANGEAFPLHGAEVHQAAGMISVQLGVSVGEAMVRLRAYAYAHSTRLGEIAKAVVARELRFTDLEDPEGER
jgi:hypothetical protein